MTDAEAREALINLDAYLAYLIKETEKMAFIPEMREHAENLKTYRAAIDHKVSQALHPTWYSIQEP